MTVNAVNTDSSSISAEINTDIDEIDKLLQATKTKEAANTTAELNHLLIEYVLAKMKGDSAGADKVSGQISSLLNQYSGDMSKANQLEAQLKAVAGDPTKQTPDELKYLEGLIASLKQDASSGQMNGF